MSDAQADFVSLESITARHVGRTRQNLSSAELAEEVIRRGEANPAASGAVVVSQGRHTQRELDATYVVSGSTREVCWLVGERFAELGAAQFAALSRRLLAYLQGRDFYVQDLVVGAPAGDARGGSQRCRVLTETAWHALLMRNLYGPALDADAREPEPELTVVHAPGFAAVPERDGTRGAAATIFFPARSLVYVCGTAYGGELCAAVSTLAGVTAPASVLPLRGAVSVDDAGDAALFLGRTGTGKTALALDGTRRLLADHSVFWTAQGLVGCERGAYASVLNLDPAREPAIHAGTQQTGAVLENVALDPGSRQPDFADTRLAVNLRAAFRVDDGWGPGPGPVAGRTSGHPRHVFLLTRDTAGVLPPLARLTPEQAVFAFLISYTSSLADTEAGQRDVRPDVEAALSNAPVAVSPAAYAKAFLERITQHGATCWFVNTGWVGEPADRAERIELSVTRTLIKAAVAGALDDVEMVRDPLFLFDVPQACPGVDPALLNPRDQAEDSAEYEIRANLLAKAFIDAFTHFAEEMPASVAEMVDSVVLFEDTLDVLENFRLSF